jgi:hypothetical protein
MVVKNPDLRRILKGMVEKEVLIPIIHTSLYDPKFKGFDIHVEEWTARPPDGYFHPSTQATWSARQMALYLKSPHLFEQEIMPLTGTLAITQGHFWHMFLQHILAEYGPLVEAEIGFTDDKHRRRGHMDGLLAIDGQSEGLEIKTMNSHTIKKMTGEEALKELKFGYWSQAQEYLDVFDLPRMRFLIICPDYPFPMKEFVVKADKFHQAARRRAYLEAIAEAESDSETQTDLACCGVPERCPARYACELERGKPDANN